MPHVEGPWKVTLESAQQSLSLFSWSVDTSQLSSAGARWTFTWWGAEEVPSVSLGSTGPKEICTRWLLYQETTSAPPSLCEIAVVFTRVCLLQYLMLCTSVCTGVQVLWKQEPYGFHLSPCLPWDSASFQMQFHEQSHASLALSLPL